MGNQLDEHVYADAQKIEELLENNDWSQATFLLGQIDYTYPYQIADLLSFLHRSLPQHKEAEAFVEVGMNRFVRIHQQYGETAISWWFDTYRYVLSGLSDHGFDLTPHYVRIYELLLTCCYFEEADSAQSAIDDACRYIGDEHPLIEQLRKWASEE